MLARKESNRRTERLKETAGKKANINNRKRAQNNQAKTVPMKRLTKLITLQQDKARKKDINY